MDRLKLVTFFVPMLILVGCMETFNAGDRVESRNGSSSEVKVDESASGSGQSANPGENPLGNVTTEVNLENGKAGAHSLD